MKNKPIYSKFDKEYYTSDSYDDYFARFEEDGRDLVARLVKLIDPDPGWRFLDVGCGMGGIILSLRELGYEAWGTEVSDYCLKNSPSRNWMKFGSVDNIDYDNESFDVVICADVLCYLNRHEVVRAAKELTRVTKHYLYVESICLNSPNSSQEENPDSLRNNNNLLESGELKKIFGVNTVFLETLYSKEETKDFNGVFVK